MLVLMLPCTLPLAESLVLLPHHRSLQVTGASEQVTAWIYLYIYMYMYKDR